MTSRARSTEHARQIVHMTMGGFALLLRYLEWWQAAILAATALAFNWYVLPRIGGTRLYRASEVARGFPPGILLYPLSVLLLILMFRHRLDIVAAAWGILAVGDGMATLVGRAVEGRRLPWNPQKTVAGSLALWLAGGAAGAFLAWWCRPAIVPEPSIWFSIGAPFVAALVAAAVETVPIRLDDNVSVPMSAAAVLVAISVVNQDQLTSAWPLVLAHLPAAVAVNLLAAVAGYRARSVSISGAIGGALIGTVIYASTGWRGWAMLFLAFLAASISSRLGLRRKMLLGIAEERGGRRGAGNAIANTGIAAAAAILAMTTTAVSPAMVAFVAALTAGGSDTIASEIGKAWGRRTFLLTTLRPVPPGTSGAVSLEGTAAGFAGALLLALAGVGLGLVPGHALAAIVIGATIGAFAESLLGATLEGPGIVNNDVLNFLNTGIAAWSAVLLTRIP
ncbi:MAG TPA: DUF92 domain-containing protein [Vicinamibacterales bacterium]|jgi:uncharacterized protein (TIGR00297 family)|nr:DUF92 domain-containing protein [Vicinamibacterales bacterium]